MTGTLPVADGRQVRAYALGLVRRHPRALGLSLLLYALAALAGLAAPPLLGSLVQDVEQGTTTGRVDLVAGLLALSVVAATALTWLSRRISFVLAEQVFADLREDFLEQVVALPLSTVERAGAGDLLSRTTADVDTLAKTVRSAVPEVLVAGVTTVLTVAAAFVVSWQVASAMLVDIRAAYGAERYTLWLRTVWFPFVDLSFALPLLGVVLLGGWLHAEGLASLAEVTAVALYTQLLLDPLDRLLSWLDEVQVGASSLARLIGVAHVPDDRSPSGARPGSEDLSARDVRFAYRDGHDVLHGLDLDVRPGERLAVVGPSGAGKSTLGRLLAGVHWPRSGSVTLGGVPLLDLPLDELRTEVLLVTQEHHVFVGTLADNLRLARPGASDDDLRAALDAVDAREWVDALPQGLGTAVGAGGLALSPAQAQQVALARLVLADPHTLVLDEATSLLDPRAARHLERSLAAVVEGRTVVAIAHRLHTASDADRVAVVEDGRVTELGSHDELLALGGSYAALWRSWQSG